MISIRPMLVPNHAYRTRFGSLASLDPNPSERLTEKMQTQWLSNEELSLEFDRLPPATLLGRPPKGFESLEQVKSTFYFGPAHAEKLSTDSTNQFSKVSWQGHEYCLKKFGIGGNAARNALNEFRTLSFFSSQGAKDVLKPVMVSIKGSGNWMLSEWLSEKPFTQKEWDKRGNTTVGQLCEKHRIAPRLMPEDRYNGVVVDTEYTGQDRFFSGEGTALHDAFMEIYNAAKKGLKP